MKIEWKKTAYGYYASTRHYRLSVSTINNDVILVINMDDKNHPFTSNKIEKWFLSLIEAFDYVNTFSWIIEMEINTV